MRRSLHRDYWFVWLILIPILLVVALLIYYPALESLQTSLTSRNLRINRPPEFVGLENYTRLLTSSEFWQVALRSLLVVVFTLPLEMLIAFAIALLLNERFPGRGVARS
jgi:ABC-type sugar transport system permease subunit